MGFEPKTSCTQSKKKITTSRLQRNLVHSSPQKSDLAQGESVVQNCCCVAYPSPTPTPTSTSYIIILCCRAHCSTTSVLPLCSTSSWLLWVDPACTSKRLLTASLDQWWLFYSKHATSGMNNQCVWRESSRWYVKGGTSDESWAGTWWGSELQ